ncbi:MULTISPECIES: flagellar protein FlaG [unclassified Fusibacter]|uniref:flagellar protein FlaG n=1 Tax=unclassified Fusibacter TaxID=2624464 RepID=UPI0010126D34|nr:MULTISPECIES: flagellar protein FlaG [unclassified Fusibacter]MCK8059831.1 flagellar protein FlaG [Fusibacter sp. A2]NPE21632.1 flagellar protein FlaG [Fusibacter sp. A1]RXV62036.1 flagellar biosynthesis protein FlaG [Fusibacter sp. A1]
MKIDGVISVNASTASIQSKGKADKSEIVNSRLNGLSLQENNQTNSEVDVVEHNEDLLNKSVKQANKSLEQFDKMIERTIHEKTKTVMYVLRDTKTHEIISEFPPKKIQDMIAKMWELAGLFVDEKA